MYGEEQKKLDSCVRNAERMVKGLRFYLVLCTLAKTDVNVFRDAYDICYMHENTQKRRLSCAAHDCTVLDKYLFYQLWSCTG